MNDMKNSRTIVLTFDDAVKSHVTNVSPILKKYGFGATFFICRFNADWRAKNSAHLLSIEEVRQLQDLGFEIGNHTVNHPDLRKCSDQECQAEVAGLNEFLRAGGIKPPVSFAYPGGPFAENAVPTLERNGLKLARTTERRPWNIKTDSPYRVPAIPLQKDDEAAFLQAIAQCGPANAVVLVFHGVPDLVHDFVSTSEPFFAKCMKHLHDNGYKVVSMAGFAGL